MDPQSPFANPNALPIIGQPKMVGGVLVITIICTCEAHMPIQGIAGSVFLCSSCQQHWLVQAEVKMAVAPVAAP